MPFNSIQQFDIKNNSNYFKQVNINSQSDEKKHLKTGVLVTSAVATTVALGLICSKQGFKFSNSTCKSFKESILHKIKEYKKIKFEEKEIVTLAGGSVMGGLIGGAIFDKQENFNSKVYESLSQMLGNVCVPVACVGLITKLYKNYKDNILKHVPQLTENSGTKKLLNRVLRAIPPVGLTTVALGTGFIAGNKVSNFINGKISGEKQNRGIKLIDLAPHVDDLCLAITLIVPETIIGTIISRTIPFFLTVPGYQTGKAQKNIIDKKEKIGINCFARQEHF